MRLFNSLTGKKEEFVPISADEVKIYSCGPTVYNYFHMGNARPFIIFDTLRKYLEFIGYKVNFVQNFTDIDDKVINRANDEGTTYDKIAERFINEYFIDANGLGIRKATCHPNATDNIDEIIDMVKTLIDKGYAYAVGGDVYFRTIKFDGYGKLSKQPIDDLKMGARIAADEKKEHPLDFALWKAAKPGEPFWTAPWGDGRPGWHIECSAMSRKYLGKTIDIHSGGVDLTFPHHENEIAQSEAANGCEFSHFWLHNAFLNVDNKKMSKSVGNFFTVRDVAKIYGYEPLRLFMLSAHYRSPLNYSKDLIEQAKNAFIRLKTARDNLKFLMDNGNDGDITSEEQIALNDLDKYEVRFKEALDDDLNTADALSFIFDMVRDINTIADKGVTKAFAKGALDKYMKLADVLTLFPNDEVDTLSAEIEALIEKRRVAREEKNWAESDKIRDELSARNVILEDTPFGVKWKIKE